MSSRSLPEFLATTPSRTTKDRPLDVSEARVVWASFESFVNNRARRATGSRGTLAEDAAQNVAVAFLESVHEGRLAAAGPVLHRWFDITARNLAWTERRKSASPRLVFGADEDAQPSNDVGQDEIALRREQLEHVRTL